MTRNCRTRGCQNPAMTDSLDCVECMAEYLRRTRIVSPWVRRAQAKELPAKRLAA